MQGFSFLDILKWWTIVVLALLAGGLGFFGYMQAYPLTEPMDVNSIILRLSNNAYLTLQLFIIDADLSAEPGIVTLHIARLLAPIATFSLVAKFLVEALYHRTVLSLLKRSSGHIIVVGLGDLGRSIAEHLSNSGHRIVAIEHEPDDDIRDFCRDGGILLVEGDGSSGAVLAKAAIGRANQVFATNESDVMNVETCVRAAQSASGMGHTINIQVHLSDQYFMGQLQSIEQELRADLSDTTFINFFSHYELVARHLMARFDLIQAARMMQQKRLHIVILGFGNLGESLFVEALLNHHSQYLGRPHFTIVDADAPAAKSRLTRRMPGIEDVAELNFLTFSAGENDTSALLETISESGPVTATFVCLAEQTRAITAALDVYSNVISNGHQSGPIFFRCDKTTSFVDNLAAAESKRLAVCLRPFRTEFGADIIEELTAEGDKLAKSIHAAYCALRAEERGEDSDAALPDAEQPWSRLPETYRKANRRAGDHLRVKLRAAGYRVQAGFGLKLALNPDDHLWSDEADLLAVSVAEHDRWSTERTIDGWRYAPVRDNDRRHHHLLVPFDDLSDAEKAKDQDQVKFLDLEVLHAGANSNGQTTLRHDRHIGLIFDEAVATIALDSSESADISDLAIMVQEAITASFPDDAFTLIAPLASPFQWSALTEIVARVERGSPEVHVYPVIVPHNEFKLEELLMQEGDDGHVKWLLDASNEADTLMKSLLPATDELDLVITISQSTKGWIVTPDSSLAGSK